MLCDSNIERFTRKNNYESLNKLNPIKRFAKKFEHETEVLKLDIKETDEIIGWFYFDEKCDANVTFTDEMQDKETENTINAPEAFKSRTNVDRGHTLIDYESILKNGLVFYENKLDEEIKKYPQNEYLLSMKESLEDVRCLIKRVSDMIDERLADCSENEKARLTEFKKMIQKVPYYPAESF